MQCAHKKKILIALTFTNETMLSYCSGLCMVIQGCLIKITYSIRQNCTNIVQYCIFFIMLQHLWVKSFTQKQRKIYPLIQNTFIYRKTDQEIYDIFFTTSCHKKSIKSFMTFYRLGVNRAGHLRPFLFTGSFKIIYDLGPSLLVHSLLNLPNQKVELFFKPFLTYLYNKCQ